MHAMGIAHHHRTNFEQLVTDGCRSGAFEFGTMHDDWPVIAPTITNLFDQHPVPGPSIVRQQAYKPWHSCDAV